MTLARPEYFYRYCSAQRVFKILEESRLYLCPPANLNDLYEGTLGRLIYYEANAARDLVARIASIRQRISIEGARQLVDEQMPEQVVREIFDGISTWLRSAAEKLRFHSGVTCFSVRRDDQRMWATYGDNHSGACIEFMNRSGTSEIHRRAQPVWYKNGSLTEKLPGLIQDDLSLDLYRLALWCYFVKSEDWRGECEWRVFSLSTQEVAPHDRLLAFNLCDIRRVFCGPRMTDNDREHLNAINRKQDRSWTLIDLKPNVHEAVTTFEGVDLLDGKKDFAYWFPEAFSNAQKA